MKTIYVVTILLLVGLPDVGWGQSVGLPFIQHYPPKTYGAHPENRAIAQDDRGVLYVGNQHGLLEFDGSTWMLQPVPGLTVRAVATDSVGTVYVGTDTNFGYLHADPRGHRQYVSLSDELSPTNRPALPVTQVAIRANEVIFSTFDQIYAYDFSKSGQHVRLLPAVPGSIQHLSVIQNQLVIQAKTGRLYTSVGVGAAEKFVSLPGTERLQTETIVAVLPYPGGRQWLLVTVTGGLFLYMPASARLRPLLTNADDWLRSAQITQAIYMPNPKMGLHTYAIGTARGGVRLFDERGHERQRIDESNGLRRNAVLSLFYDREKSLWIGTGSGLDRVEFTLPVSRFDGSLNVRSTVWAIQRHGDRLYIGTSLGLLGWNDADGRFGAVAGADAVCRTLLADGPNLWAGGTGHIWRVQAGQVRETILTDNQPVNILLRTRPTANAPGLLLAGLDNGLRAYRKQNDHWQDAGLRGGLPTGIVSLGQTADGTVWIGTRHGGFFSTSGHADRPGAGRGLAR